MSTVIRVDNVSRWFGSVVAVSDVSFDIGPGITGLLGPNGAGKTTLLRMMTGLAQTSRGTVTVFGEPVRDNPSLYGRIGVMSEHETVYGFMKGREFVQMMGSLRGVNDLERAVDKAIALVDLADAQHRPMDTYSRGMRQRMRLAATLVHDPKLLILDEPTRGLDPVQIVEMRNMIQNLKEKHTVLISSHILTEISETCDRILVLGEGEIIASGTEESLLKNIEPAGGTTWKVSIAVVPKPGGDPYRDGGMKALLGGLTGVTEVEDTGKEDDALSFEVTAERDVRSELCRKLVEAGHGVVRLGGSERKLENIFLKLVQGGGDRARN
jgi:ABC-2 type transport system ATP-binding protein